MAKELNTCVIRWCNPVKIGSDEYRDDFATLRLLAQTMPAIESLYVFRGACMLLDNINPAKQLANGTRGEFWGLVWDKSFDLVPGSTPPWRFRDEGDEPMTMRDFVGVSPGEDVWVPPPSYVVMRTSELIARMTLLQLLVNPCLLVRMPQSN